MHRSVRFVLFVLIVATFAGAVSAGEDDFLGRWRGIMAIREDPIVIELWRGSDGAMYGSMFPREGITRGIALTDIEVFGDRIRFKMQGGAVDEPRGDLTLGEDFATMTGTMIHGGAVTDVSFKRIGDSTVPLMGLDRLIEKAIADFDVPGLAIAIVSKGEIVYAKGFGHRDVEAQAPMTVDTLFAIGSTTKAMTATLLGMLVDEGKLAWDEPVRDFLPGFALSDATVTERITPRDLVTHRSGLPRHDLLWYNNNESTRADLVARLAYLELTADLREKFQYNNLLFMTAGYLSAQVAGTTWEDLIRTRLFEPLGMERSNVSVDVSQQDDDHAVPYIEKDDALERVPFRKIDLVGPAGSVNSSVREMSRWLLLNLGGGEIDGQRLVSASTMAEIQSPQMTVGATQDRPDVSVPTYGMGWMIDTYRGHRRVSHGGGIDGFITSVMLFPDDELGIVAFNNCLRGIPRLVAQSAADRILGLEHVDWLGEALERRQKGKAADEEAEAKKESTRVAGTSPSHSLQDYAGRYDNPGYGAIEFTLAEGVLSVHYNGIVAPLEHWHYDVWTGSETEGDNTFEDQRFQFRSDVDGRIAAVESLFEARAEPIRFHKGSDPRLSDPAFLARLAGTYETATGTKFTIELAGETLHGAVPGSPPFTLDPALGGRFVISANRSVQVEFEIATGGDGPATKMLIYNPSGVYEAARVED